MIFRAKEKQLKIVALGDEEVGKTCLLIRYAYNAFAQEYMPTVFDNYCLGVEIGNNNIHLALMDTSGQAEYDRLRALAYPQADVFLLVFSATNPASFHNIKTKWWPEVMHFCPGVKIILVSAKIDLFADKEVQAALRKRNQQPITRSQGRQLAQDIKAIAYMECSALMQIGLKGIFDLAMLSVIEPQKKSQLTMTLDIFGKVAKFGKFACGKINPHVTFNFLKLPKFLQLFILTFLPLLDKFEFSQVSVYCRILLFCSAQISGDINRTQNLYLFSPRVERLRRLHKLTIGNAICNARAMADEKLKKLSLQQQDMLQSGFTLGDVLSDTIVNLQKKLQNETEVAVNVLPCPAQRC